MCGLCQDEGGRNRYRLNWDFIFQIMKLIRNPNT